MEDAKKMRITAKRLFTRSRNITLESINRGDDISRIESKFNQVKRRFDMLQEANAEYLYCAEKDVAYNEQNENTWIESIESDYDELEREYFELIKSEAKGGDKSTIQNLETENVRTSQLADITKARNIREFEGRTFEQEIQAAYDVLNADENPEVKQSLLLEGRDNIKSQKSNAKMQASAIKLHFTANCFRCK